MAEMIFRIPSRTVTYGYVELPVDLEAGASPEMIAATYVNYVYAFQKEEEKAVKAIASGVTKEKATSAPVTASTEADDLEAIRAATEALDKGLGGVTEVPGEIVGHEGTSTQAPWVEVVEAKPKPWEKNGKAPAAPAKVATIDWS